MDDFYIETNGEKYIKKIFIQKGTASAVPF